MSLLKDLVSEMAAAGVTAAHAVGGHGGHETTRGTGLFRGGRVKPRKRNMVSRAHRMGEGDVKPIKHRNSWNWRIIGEMMDETQFDASDVMSKLDAAEKKAKNEQDTVPFGLEDEDGNVIKVYVKAEEADEFESALSAMLAGEDENDDDMNTGMEIAEVLFQLKDKFQIVDVQWPNIEGDEEEEQEMAGAPGGEPGAEGEMGMGEPGAEGEAGAEGGIGEPGAEGDLDAELGLGGEGEGEGEGEGLGDEEGDMAADTGPEGMLQQVIDTMKADAEARKADAEAREAEAKAREAEANANASANKVKQEEQVLDMEQWEKDQKSQEDETSKLARLAKMKHQQAQDAEVQASQEEEERLARGEDTVKLTQREMLNKILDALQRNS